MKISKEGIAITKDVIEEIQKYVKDEDFISQCETYISHICEYLRIKG